MGQPLKLLIVVVAAAVALLGWSGPACACNDVETTGRILGVAKDGRFAHITSSPVNGCGCLVETFTIHDKDGTVLLQASHEDSDWEVAEGFAEDLADLIPKPREALPAVSRRAIETLRLRPLVASQVPILASPQDEEHSACLTFEAYARGSGTVVADLDALYLGCSSARASLYSHPSSSFYFIRYVSGWRRTGAEPPVCSAYHEDFTWVPRARIQSATLTARAARLADPSSPRAGELLHEAARADATNGRAVVGFVEWLSRTTAWATAKPRLESVLRARCLDLASYDSADRLSDARERFAERDGLEDADFDEWWSDLVSKLACASD